MNIFSDEEQADIDFVDEYDRKIRSFEWIIDADKASKAFLDNSFSPLHTVGTSLQKAMSNYRSACRQISEGIVDPEDIASLAYEARLCIEDALDRGIIREGEGLTGRLNEAKKKIEELEKEKVVLENQLILVTKKKDELEKEKKSFRNIKASSKRPIR